MNNKISEIKKNTLEGITSRLDEAEGRITKLEYKVERNTQNEQEKEKRLRKNKQVVRENARQCETQQYPCNRDTRRRRRRARDTKTV